MSTNRLTALYIGSYVSEAFLPNIASHVATIRISSSYTSVAIHPVILSVDFRSQINVITRERMLSITRG